MENSKEWLLQGRENGFVPYWWDNGGSASLEMPGKKTERPAFPCTNDFTGKANPEFRLSGWSHGSSNHLAQDLAILVQQAWVMLSGSKDEHEQKLAAECALAAKKTAGVPRAARQHLRRHSRRRADWQRCRADETREVVQKGSAGHLSKHFTRAVRDFKPGEKADAPGFADDAMYLYYGGVAEHGTQTRPLALKLASMWLMYLEEKRDWEL